jgi:hypothetical protein
LFKYIYKENINMSDFLTTSASVKSFMASSGYMWRTILASTTTSPVTYLDVAPTGGGSWDGNTMQGIVELRDLFANNAANNMSSARQPAHFDHASVLTAAARSVETAYATAVKNAVSGVISKWDTFIKAEAPTASGSATITTTKAYIDYLFTKAEWVTQMSSYGADFLDFWRYTMRNELRVPIKTLTYNGATWTEAIVTGTTSGNSGELTYGSALEARYITKGAGPASELSITAYTTTDSAGDTAVTGATLALTEVYVPATRATASYKALGTKTNLLSAKTFTITGAQTNDVVAIYSV